jgi:ABC-type lipoprotein export system ATPase subunit
MTAKNPPLDRNASGIAGGGATAKNPPLDRSASGVAGGGATAKNPPLDRSASGVAGGGGAGLAVRAHDVFCLYPTPSGHVAALRGLTLDVSAGERVVVHGPNGSGKTTLMRVLAGEQGIGAGTVTVCGVDIAGASAGVRAGLRGHRLGLIDQYHGRTLRPELTVRDNVALQLRLTGVRRGPARQRATDLLDRLGLAYLERCWPGELSGGEAQRVAVCASVAHGPQLVLADEPTGELDRASADTVYDLLVEVTAATGAALVLVSHDVRATRVADRVVRIRDGRLSEEWTPDRAGDETLVVDDRGWVRLPAPLRAGTGTGSRVRAAARDGEIVLSAVPAEKRDLPQAPAAGPTPPPVREPALVDGDLAVLAGVGVARAGRTILSGQDLRLQPASLTALRGRSGSGKTTLLRILTGLERPDTGSVQVAGADLATLDRSGLAALRRAYVSVAGQTTVLAESIDVTANLDLVRQARGLPPDPAAVEHWIEALGLTALRHRPVRVLSGGERQRVAVARVLAVAPAIAVLDEPTSQQDEANAERVVAVLAAAARAGTAVLAATHDPALVAAADELVTLP